MQGVVPFTIYIFIFKKEKVQILYKYIYKIQPFCLQSSTLVKTVLWGWVGFYATNSMFKTADR